VELHKQINLLQAAYFSVTLELFGKNAANSRFFQFQQFSCGFLTWQGADYIVTEDRQCEEDNVLRRDVQGP